jgi:DNA-damage-inducible protein D
MTNEIEIVRHATFESIRRVNQHGQDFWSARELGKILGYSEYRHFLPVIEKARESCKNSGQTASDHFEDILEMVDIGSGAKREMPIHQKKLSHSARHISRSRLVNRK